MTPSNLGYVPTVVEFFGHTTPQVSNYDPRAPFPVSKPGTTTPPIFEPD